jgi:DNA invertase Pin-like site-specific DNA recombinase
MRSPTAHGHDTARRASSSLPKLSTVTRVEPMRPHSTEAAPIVFDDTEARLIRVDFAAASLEPSETSALPMPRYGYARVSTLDQDLTLQRAALKAAGCEVIRAEKASGTRRDGRTELQVLLDFLRAGDTLVVTRIDRLARSLKNLQDIVHELKGRGVALKATEQPIDTGTAAGKAFLDMLGVFAEFETNLRRQRQLEGIQVAKARGVYKGRKPSIDAAEVRRLYVEEKLGPAAIARRLRIGRASVYRLIGRRATALGSNGANRADQA